MKGYRKYFGKKILWFVITFIIAVILNFVLPRLMPADPVAAITGKLASGMTDASAVQEIYKRYEEEFGTNKSIPEQFFIFCGNAPVSGHLCQTGHLCVPVRLPELPP